VTVPSPAFPAHLLRSSRPGLSWPALPNADGALVLALQFQLAQTHWEAPADIELGQFRQLANLLRQAHATIPFWRERLEAASYDRSAAAPAPEWFRTLPVLTRREVQALGDALLSNRVPPEHGHVARGQTSGSTGRPISFYVTQVSQLFWLAFTLRDHLWHGRDLAGKLAAIRIKVENESGPGWGPATDAVFHTGPSATLNIRTDIDEQLAWLDQHDPDYLITHPSNLRALVRRAIEKDWRPRRLREARTFAEALPDDLRALCREAWNVKLCDAYSAEETGYIALQCPEREHYHVQAESLIVEIVDQRGEPCRPGETGRVVVTTLQNFAMPLIRYEIGDYAVAGAVCPCGRGLPVIERILGRKRNMLRLLDGRRYYPSFPAEDWAGIAPIRQLQVVQRTLDDIELRLVAERPLTAPEEARLFAAFQRSLAHPFRIALAYRDQIGRSGNYKFEDFISELDD
jgi:phenylacetate-CoA ligase